MSSTRLVGLLAVVFLMAAGQVLFKLAASRLADFEMSVAGILALLLNPFLMAGLVVYAATTILWVFLLVDGDLTKSYPFTALSLVLVSLAGVVFFGESVSPALLIGGGLILSGLAVIAYW